MKQIMPVSRKFRMINLIVLLALVCLLISATGIQAQTISPPAPVSPTSAAVGPAITSISLVVSPPGTPLASPEPGTTYIDVKVSIQVSGFNLVDKVGQANVPGEGHIIYYWAEPPTYPYRGAYTYDGSYSNGTIFTTFTWTNSATSYDVYAAQLVNNDDTPLSPPVYAMIFSNNIVPGISADLPSINSFSLSTALPASPVAGADNKTYMDTKVSSQSSGLSFTPAASQSNVPGQGHFIYYWEVAPLTAPNYSAYITDGFSFATASNPFTFTGDSPGYRSYAVQIVNNDDTPLNPPVYAVIKTNIGLGMGGSSTPTGTSASSPSPTVLPSLNPSAAPERLRK